MILAAGARPTVPEIPGLDDTPFHTTDTIMRVDALPARWSIIGGGPSRPRLGHVFAAFGTAVTIVEKESQSARRARRRHRAALHRDSARDRFDVRLGDVGRRVEQTANGVAVHLEGGTRAGSRRRGGAPRRSRAYTEHRRARRRRGRRRGRRAGPRDHRRLPRHERPRSVGDRRSSRITCSSSTSRTRRCMLAMHNVLHPDDAAPRDFPVHARRGVRRSAGCNRRADRAGAARTGQAVHRGRPRLRGHGLRVGAREHDRLRQAPRRSRDAAACSRRTSSGRRPPRSSSRSCRRSVSTTRSINSRTTCSTSTPRRPKSSPRRCSISPTRRRRDGLRCPSIRRRACGRRPRTVGPVRDHGVREVRVGSCVVRNDTPGVVPLESHHVGRARATRIPGRSAPNRTRWMLRGRAISCDPLVRNDPAREERVPEARASRPAVE